MGAPTVISVGGLGKRYRLGAALKHDTLRDQIAHFAKRVATGGRAERARREEFWALREVGFDVARGEVVGIIGRNGAGKSTLLKILSQITEPTEGEVRIRGRVASLLEVGTGFHPELSGRENIFLNGAILGMSRREIAAKFDEIVAFSEVGDFLETPVKRYSSGMYVRLAFAVAAHLEPEILIVDEVLAVGDASFQKKCLGKMRDVAGGGRTILFVSHNMVAVQMLCPRAIWLDRGRVKMDGPTDRVVNDYLSGQEEGAVERVWGFDEAPGDGEVKLRRACARPEGGVAGDPISVAKPVVLEFDFWNLKAGGELHWSVHVFDVDNSCVFATNTVRARGWSEEGHPQGLYRSQCTVPAHFFNDGTFKVKVLAVKEMNRVLFGVPEAVVFEVIDDDLGIRGGWFGKWPGVVRPKLDWATERIGELGEGAAP
jgi:lipopolysaccharide transport system ATP-binding protein